MQNPVNGADERMIEASWGLEEAVVAGRVIPDNYLVDRSGRVVGRAPGVKKIAIRTLPDGGTVEKEVAPELVERPCLDDAQLEQLNALAGRCEEVYGPARDIEWAFAGGELCLPVQGRHTGRYLTQMAGAPVEVLKRVPLFAELNRRELGQSRGCSRSAAFARGRRSREAPAARRSS